MATDVITDNITDSKKQVGITVKTDTFIDRISLKVDNAGVTRANSVFLQDTTCRKTFVEARKDVIISAGTYGSLGVLIRSGIGAKQDVEKLGIESQVDIPGVGRTWWIFW